MTDTIDRLVRMLDDARTENRELRGDRHRTNVAALDAQDNYRKAEAKIKEWEQWANLAVLSMPPAIQKRLQPRPGPLELDIPF